MSKDFMMICPACEKTLYDRDLAVAHLHEHSPREFNCCRCPVCGTFQPEPDAVRLCCPGGWSGEVCTTCWGFKFQRGGGPCPDCNGTGMAEPGAKNAPRKYPPISKMCPACKGAKTERFLFIRYNCPRCDGKGSIPGKRSCPVIVNPHVPNPLPW